MKIILCLLSISFATFVDAQNSILLKSVKKVPDLVDTTNMYASKYGNVARLTIDNMPCIMPYNNTVKIPNSSEKQNPGDIPNAWRGKASPLKPESKQKRKIPNAFPKKYKHDTPSLWKKDSMTLRMIPEKEH